MRRHDRLPRPWFLLLALAAATAGVDCAAPVDGDEATAQSDDALYVLRSTVWSNRSIPVCWQNGSAAEREWVRDAVMSTWPRVANVTFTGWGDCTRERYRTCFLGICGSWQERWTNSYQGIQIRVADENPRTQALGSRLAGMDDGMTLNFAFNSWNTWSSTSEANREYSIRVIAVHEFGHALGFAHEQNRPDTNRETCVDAPQGTSGDMTLGPWDPDSVMNYCNPRWNNDGQLSPGDIAGVQQIYGPRVPGDNRLGAIPLALGAGETTVTGTTVDATNDSPASSVGCRNQNVWYRFALSRDEVVYFDTAGSGFDTSLVVTNADGAAVDGMANDDVGCTGGDWRHPSGYESAVGGYLAAGTYLVSVSGCATGAFTLHAQHMPVALGAYYEGVLRGAGVANTATFGTAYGARGASGTGTTDWTYLTGTSALSGSCGGTASAEDVRWFVACGGQSALFSVCASDGGQYTRSNGTRSFDPAIYLWRGTSGDLDGSACNDDGGSGNDCVGTGGDSNNWGSRLATSANRGLNAVVVDERSGGSGTDWTQSMNYGMFWRVN
jgi:hypothetical protein